MSGGGGGKSRSEVDEFDSDGFTVGKDATVNGGGGAFADNVVRGEGIGCGEEVVVREAV